MCVGVCVITGFTPQNMNVEVSKNIKSKAEAKTKKNKKTKKGVCADIELLLSKTFAKEKSARVFPVFWTENKAGKNVAG